MHGILGNAIYGGRIDNKIDYRKLVVYLSLCFSDETLSASGKPSLRKLIPGITLPRSSQKSDFTALINQLQDQDDANMFGLPVNINRQVQEEISRSIFRKQTLLVGNSSFIILISSFVLIV